MEETPVGTEPAGDAPRLEAPLGAGTVLGDRYRLVRCIGEGGMGSIWQADHLALDTAVAIKLIRRAQVDDERARARFLREARAAASLRSPHVVQIFDYGVHGTVPYIAMELLHGESLADHIRSRGALTPAHTFALLSQVARAIGKAHDAGLVHRDLKPDNIFLVAGDGGHTSGEYVAKLLDFGIAKRALEEETSATSTSVGGVLGTPYYMSPEQLVDASSAGAPSNLWSLAVIAYECLLGERPFRGSGVAELAVAVLTEPRPVPSTRGEVPAGFDAWFLTATAADPSRRFEDVHACIDHLALALGVESARSSAALPVLDVPAASRATTPVAAKRWSVGTALFWAAAIGGVALAVLALRRPAASVEAAPIQDPEPIRAAAPLPEPEPASVPTAPVSEPPIAEPSTPQTSENATPAAADASAATGAGGRTKSRKRPRERPPVSDTATLHDVSELEP